MKDFLVAEAAIALGMSGQRVRFLIKQGRLKAVKRGRDWLVPAKEIERFQKLPRRVGRPAKV